MARKNPAWGEFLTVLLKKHGLSTYGAELKCQGAVSSSYIGQMMSGTEPQYRTAVGFLAPFDEDERSEGMGILGYPLPAEWQPTDALERIDIALAGTTGLSDEEKQGIREIAAAALEGGLEDVWIETIDHPAGQITVLKSSVAPLTEEEKQQTIDAALKSVPDKPKRRRWHIKRLSRNPV